MTVAISQKTVIRADSHVVLSREEATNKGRNCNDALTIFLKPLAP